MFVFMFNSLRVMLVAQDKQQCNYQSVISVLYAIATIHTGLWDISKRDRSTSTKINAVIAHRRFCPHLSNQEYGQNYNNRKMVIEITGLKPLWLFFWFVVASNARCLQCACANGVFYPTTSWLGFEVVVGAVGTVCLAGLVGVVGDNFGEVVLLVGVGWLVLQL